MQVESYSDVSICNVLFYTDSRYENTDSVLAKLLNQIKSKYKKVIVYSNVDINVDDVIVKKEILPLKALLSNICYRENSKFIGIMKTNTFLYYETISYLKCANIQYRIYDTINQKWVIGNGDVNYG